MKLKELKELASEELQQREKTLKKELFALYYQRQATGRVEKPGQFRNLKREIARMLTLLKERELHGTSNQA